MKRLVFAVIFSLCILATLLLLGATQQGSAAEIIVDDDNVAGPWDGSMATPYQNITSAIAAANPGDNITVWDGQYDEDITVNVRVNLTGNGSAVTTINGTAGAGNVISVSSDWANISGFNVTGTAATGWAISCARTPPIYPPPITPILLSISVLLSATR